MLDLTSAVRSGPELVIELRVSGGDVELILTPGMVVDANELAVRRLGQGRNSSGCAGLAGRWPGRESGRVSCSSAGNCSAAATRRPHVVGLSAAVYNPNGNLALTAAASASDTLAGFPPSNANDGNQATYWQGADSTGQLELALAEPAPVDRIVLELPQGWGDRDQTIEVDGAS